MPFLGLILFVVGVIAIFKNGLPALRIPNRITGVVLLGVAIVFFAVGAPPEEGEPTVPPVAQTEDPTPTPAEEEPEPVPTPAPVEEEIEPVPDAIVYTGTGDSVIKIEKPEEGPVMLYIKGNDTERHFAVTGFDADDNRTTLFVNTTNQYEGITLDPGGTTDLLEIKGYGSWIVESRSIRSARIVESPGSISGTGDEVLLVEGDPTLATIEGNPDARHFAVLGYSPNRNLMINTTDVYKGTVRVQRGTFVLEINAVGDWNISLE